MAYKDVICSNSNNNCCCGLAPFVNAKYDNNKLTLIRGDGELVDLEIAANAVSNLSKDPSVLLDLINQALKKQSDITKITDGTTITADGNGKLAINPSGIASRLADGTTITADTNGKLGVNTSGIASGLADGTTIKATNGKLSVDTNALSSQIIGSTHRLVNSTGEVVLGHILA